MKRFFTETIDVWKERHFKRKKKDKQKGVQIPHVTLRRQIHLRSLVVAAIFKF